MTKTNNSLSLQGLRAAPSQVCGAFRLVPLIRDFPCNDVRITVENYQKPISRVSLDYDAEYWSFIPHGFILSWGTPKDPLAAIGSQIKKSGASKTKWFGVQDLSRMVKRNSSNSVRMLPLHLSMEYFLSLSFVGSDIMWSDFSKFAKRYGLGCRYEYTRSGRSLYQLDEAIRTFEINENQVGVLAYAGEELATAFVVPSAEDYRALHATLIEDFFSELIYRYALWHETQDLKPSFDLANAKSLTDLREGLQKARAEWSEISTRVMSSHLLDRTITTDAIYRPGSMVLERFMTDLDLNGTNTIGERLVKADGELLYLKTYRLDADQTKRAWWLTNLKKNNWNLQMTADALKMDLNQLIRGVARSGFGYIINPELLRKAMK